MARLTSVAIGAVIGFALVFLGLPGLALGLVAAVAYVRVTMPSHPLERVGPAVVGGGLVVMFVAGRVVLTSLGDPGVTHEPSTAVAAILGAVAATAGAYLSVRAQSRRRADGI